MEYYFGLDLGTNSVGWAATNTEYDFLRLKGKTAWGSRIFDEAKDCKERRTFRSNRRRMNRRKYRIYLLNQLFAEYLTKIDSNFFMRLENSNLLLEDKDANLGVCSIFKTNKEEKEFYKNYPTVWHLRNALIKDDKKAFSDLRYVYLAIHHILKYRGNFLKEGQEFNSGTFDYEILDQINIFFKGLEQGDNTDLSFISKKQGEEIKKIVLQKENKKVRQKQIEDVFDNKNENNKVYIDLFKTLVTGGCFNLKKITNEDSQEIEFNDKFEENRDLFANKLGDAMVVVDVAKQIYDFYVLYNLLGDKTYLSDAMLIVYEDHKEQLKDLKKVLKEYCKKNNDFNVFYRIFNKKKYVELNKRENKKVYDIAIDKDVEEDKLFGYYSIKHNNSTKKDEFKKVLKELNKNYFKDDVIKIIDNNFFPLICEKSTSIIPYQLHEMELNLILKNASKYYEFINEKFIDNILKILKYRIPFYCGPLDNRSKKYSNVVRNENITITPWNIDDVIDKNKTKENFIRRLINKCTYLEEEEVIPKASLLYEEYILLNNINNLKIGHVGANNPNSKLDKTIKNELIKYISGLNKKVSLKSIENRFKKLYGDDITISGVDENITFNRLNYNLLKDYFDIEKEKSLVEKLIKCATIYADNKFELKKELKNKGLNENQIKCVLKIQTSKWAPFSQKFLDGIYSNPDENGEIFTIIDLLRETDKNLQEIINDEKYGFKDKIDQLNKNFRGDKNENQIIKEMLENTPAKFRRPINQALLILDDVEKAAKRAPKKIFVEVTREDNSKEEKKKKKKDSRKEELEKFIKALENDKKFKLGDGLKVLSNELKEIDEDKIKSKAVYLYFKQLGFDIYTGEKIDLNDVINGGGKYDIDHIVPKSLIYNDSIDNTVLVSRYVNQNVKKDFYPIPLEIRSKKEIQELWKMLLDKNAISKDKYLRLTRATELTDEELTEFINSQINAVNYSNKVLINILKIKYPNVNIVFSKAQYPSYIRQKWGIAKLRDLNDAHHAVDAYLNIVAGDILSSKFNNPKNYICEYKKGKIGEDKEKSFNMQNAIYYKLNRNNLWEKIKRNSLRRDALVTYKTDYENGAFYKQTIKPCSDNLNGSLIPIHTKTLDKVEWEQDCNKYGGFCEMKNSGLVFVEYKKNNKIIRKIVGKPLIFEKLYKENNFEYYKLLLIDEKNVNQIKDVKIIKQIAIGQKIQYEGGIYLLRTKGKLNLEIATQNYLNNENACYLQYFLNEERLKNIDDGLLERQVFISNIKENKEEGKHIVSKQMNKQILEELINKINNKRYDSCEFIKKCRDIDFTKFDIASLKNQLTIIKSLIVLLSRNARYSTFSQEMKKIGYDVFSTYLFIKSNLKEGFVLINESPSGLFVKKEKVDGI